MLMIGLMISLAVASSRAQTLKVFGSGTGGGSVTPPSCTGFTLDFSKNCNLIQAR